MDYKKIIGVCALLIATTSQVRAATIYLKDGSLIKGTIVSATAQDMQVNTEDGLLKIKADRISKIDYAGDASQPPLPQNIPTTSSAPPPPPNDVGMEEPAPPPAVQYRHVRRVRVEPAEPIETHQSLSLDFGIATPLSRVNFNSAGGGTDDNGDTGILIGMQYLYQTAPRWGLGFNLEYMDRGLSNSSSLVPSAETDVSGDSLLIMPVVKFSIVDHGNVRPYLMAGIGTNRTSTFIEAQPQVGFVWDDTNTDETRTLVNDSHWGLATTARVGIDFLAYSSSFLSIELGWTGIDNKSYTATQAGKDLGLDSVTGNLSTFNLAGRWGMRF